MVSKYCVSCGTPVGGSRFCTKCGRPIADAPAPESPGWDQADTLRPGSAPVYQSHPPTQPNGPSGVRPRRRAGVALAAVALVLILAGVAAGVVLWIGLPGSDAADGAAPAPGGATPTADAASPQQSSPADAGSTVAASPAGVTAPDNLECTDQFLVVFKVTNDETQLDKGQPWLQAEQSCSGIDRELDGKPLRFNYLGPFATAQEACQQLLELDPHADFVKLLRADQAGGRHYLCSCDLPEGELPYLRETGGEYPQDKLEFRSVTDLHLMLKRIQGFKSDNLGLYGPQTSEEVMEFQATEGLAVTGDVDAATWGALLGSPRACPD